MYSLPVELPSAQRPCPVRSAVCSSGTDKYLLAAPYIACSVAMDKIVPRNVDQHLLSHTEHKAEL
jgi:hypothetical protein